MMSSFSPVSLPRGEITGQIPCGGQAAKCNLPHGISEKCSTELHNLPRVSPKVFSSSIP